jgi:7-cyano-7-deazaguanine synthase
MLLGIAQSKGAEIVALGTHKGDHTIYPDCRSEYIDALRITIELASDGAVTLKAPFQNTDKSGILEVGFQLEVPYHLTRTCYKDQPISCGKCGSCVERQFGFRNIGKVDPIEYVDAEYFKQFIELDKRT